MLRRRDFLKGVGAAATVAAVGGAGSAGAVEAAGGRWTGYRDAMTIDGLSGIMAFWLEPGDPGVAEAMEQVRASGMTALIDSVAPQGRFWMDDAAFERNRDALARRMEVIEAYPDILLPVREYGDLERARRERRLGIVFTFQGTEPLGEDIERIGLFHELGLRVMQLTHNRRNLVGDGALEPGNAGLSNFGHAVVERLNAQRIVIDLSHGSQRTTAEGIRASAAPVLIGHTGCRALADLPRNTGDAELRAMAERGGVAGIIFWPYLRTDTQPMAEDVIAHIEHALNVCGEDHVGIGTDIRIEPIERTPAFERENREWIQAAKATDIFDANRPDDLYPFIPDLNVADRFERVAALLSARGHSDARIEKILGRNFARVLREVWG